jgi:chorismate mutase/prephenate dehydratase
LKLESRPARNSSWEYVFHIDIDGHCVDESIQKALHDILELGVSVKVLGAYPVAV